MLDKKGQTPLYIQLMNIIQKKIEDGIYPEGTAIPSERELCNMYEVSRITVRQAIQLAVSEGLLVRRPGKGTYVSTRKLVQSLQHITLFDKTLIEQGLFPRTSVIEIKNIMAPTKVYKALDISKRLPLVRITLLGIAESEPLAIYVSHFRPELGEHMAKKSSEWGSQGRAFTSFDLYEDVNNDLCPTRVQQTFEADLASGSVARHLKTDEFTALFTIESVVESRSGLPVEHRIAKYKAERYRFSITREMKPR